MPIALSERLGVGCRSGRVGTEATVGCVDYVSAVVMAIGAILVLMLVIRMFTR